MSKEFNPYGLYKNIVPRYEIPTLHSDEKLDDQTNGLWLPFYDKEGNLHLVDTFHIGAGAFYGVKNKDNKFTPKGDNATDKFIAAHNNMINEKADGEWWINQSNREYYYGGSIALNDISWECYFEEVCDLRNYHLTTDPNKYDNDDCISFVKLWWEHCYPYGVDLVRDDAKESDNAKASYLINRFYNNMSKPGSPSYCIEELKELNPTDKNIIKSIKQCERMDKKLKELTSEWNKFMVELHGGD